MKVLLKTLTWKGFFFKNQDNESAKYCHFQYKMHTVLDHIVWVWGLYASSLYNMKFTTLITCPFDWVLIIVIRYK